jgi:hypothetical protein
VVLPGATIGACYGQRSSPTIGYMYDVRDRRIVRSPRDLRKQILFLWIETWKVSEQSFTSQGRQKWRGYSGSCFSGAGGEYEHCRCGRQGRTSRQSSIFDTIAEFLFFLILALIVCSAPRICTRNGNRGRVSGDRRFRALLGPLFYPLCRFEKEAFVCPSVCISVDLSFCLSAESVRLSVRCIRREKEEEEGRMGKKLHICRYGFGRSDRSRSADKTFW